MLVKQTPLRHLNSPYQNTTYKTFPFRPRRVPVCCGK